MHTIRELKQQEKYHNMLKRKNKEKNIYKSKNSTLRIEKMNLIKAVERKNKEIERLNNIINDLLDRQNEALRYIGNHLSLDSRYKHGNGDEELILVRKILNKHIKELEQGSDKE